MAKDNTALDQPIVNSVSFDEMESLMGISDNKDSSDEVPAESVMQKGEETPDESESGVVKKLSEKSVDEPTIPEEVKSAKENAEEKKKEKKLDIPKDEDLENAAPNPDKSEVKILKGKWGDQEVELAADATFMHKVDGEDVEVSVQELLNNYSGKTAWDKKFTELGTQRREFETEKTNLNGHLNHFIELAQGENPVEAFDYLATLGGLDPLELRRHMRAQFIPQVEKYMQLDETGRQHLEAQEELEWMRKQRESEHALMEERTQQEALVHEVRQVQEAHGIDDATFLNYYDELVNAIGDKQEVTPELVGEYYVSLQAKDRALSVLSGIQQDLAENTALVKEVMDLVIDNDFSDEEIQEIVVDSLGIKTKKSKAKAVSEKVNKAEAAKKAAPKPAKKTGEPLITFDDLF